MKRYTISIQNGLDSIAQALVEAGHTLIPYDQAGLKADIVIISGVDSAYEEIETAQCRIGSEGKELLLINASGLKTSEVLRHIEQNKCHF